MELQVWNSKLGTPMQKISKSGQEPKKILYTSNVWHRIMEAKNNFLSSWPFFSFKELKTRSSIF
jgi:hypothetical protein